MKCDCGGTQKATNTQPEVLVVKRRRVCDKCKKVIYTLEEEKPKANKPTNL